MSILVIIVNYKTAALTIDCLYSLAAEVAVLPGVEVVITDNASGDDSVERISGTISDNGWNTWARVQALPRNGGFAYGNNMGIRPALAAAAPPDFVLLLNPDTVVRPGAIAALRDFLVSHPRVGIAGSRLEHPDGRPQRSAFRFPSVSGEFEHGIRFAPISRLFRDSIVAPPPPSEASASDWVAGASMMIRKQVFDAIGLMDEGYFMYFEEVDFCRRARDAGWTCWYVPQSRIVHLVGQSSGVTDARRSRRRRPRYWFAARRRYFLHHLGFWHTLLADMLWAGGFGLFRVRQFIQRKPDAEPDRLLRDFVEFNLVQGVRQHRHRRAAA